MNQVETLLGLFETQSRGRLADNTIDRVKRDIRMICKDMHIDNLDQFTTEVITIWSNGRLTGMFGRRPLVRTSVAAVHSSLRSFLNVMEENGIEHSVDRKQLIYCNRYKEKKPLREADIRRILRFAPDRETAVLINLLFFTGMRISEVLALKAEDISPENEIIVSGKSKHTRSVFLNDRLRWELRSLHNDEGYFFRERRNPYTHISRKNASYHLTNTYRLAGYTKGFSPHSERHGNITHLLSSGANMAVVSKAAGHADIATTQIYTHLVTDDVRKMVDEHMPIIASFDGQVRSKT